MTTVINACEWISSASKKLFACSKRINENNCPPQKESEKIHNINASDSGFVDDTLKNFEWVEESFGLPKNAVELARTDSKLSKEDFESPEKGFELTNIKTPNDEKNLFFHSGINTQREARSEASMIFCHCLGIDKIQLRLRDQFSVTEEQSIQLSDCLDRRMLGEPLSYVFGRKEFFGIDFLVNQYTLIPRPETEFLVDEALAYGGNVPRLILDLGCGSGCIALSILKNKPDWRGVLVDISTEALAVARENAISLGVEKRAHFILGDFTSESFKTELLILCKEISSYKEHSLGKEHSSGKESPFWKTPEPMYAKDAGGEFIATETMRFDIIISNPPYIPMEEYENLHLSVKDYEPQIALVSYDLMAKDMRKDTSAPVSAHTSTPVSVHTSAPVSVHTSAHTSALTVGSFKTDEMTTLTQKGLFHAQSVILLAEEMLKSQGLLLIEHGYNQAEACRSLCDDEKWDSICSGRDYSGIERYLKAFLKK